MCWRKGEEGEKERVAEERQQERWRRRQTQQAPPASPAASGAISEAEDMQDATRVCQERLLDYIYACSRQKSGSLHLPRSPHPLKLMKEHKIYEVKFSNEHKQTDNR